MTCEDAHLHMHDYISGELSPEHHQPLMDHLDECSDCSNFLMQTRHIQATLRDSMRCEAPGELQTAVSGILANA